MIRSIGLNCLLLMFFTTSLAQDRGGPNWLKKMEELKLNTSIRFQFWASYTTDAKVLNVETNTYEEVDNRLNFMLRRSQFSLKAQPYKDLTIHLIAAMDFVGRDLLSGHTGGANNGASPIVRLWVATFLWKISKKSDAFNLVGGYFTPRFSRSSINSAFRVPSMEKAWSQNYIRRHIVGIGPGRSIGINLGGLLYREERFTNWSYGIGFFNPTFSEFGNNSAGTVTAPLLTGRWTVHFGDPEMTKYGLGHKQDYFGKRNGFTLAINGAYQGKTNLFVSNTAASIDVLYNQGMFSLGGEYIRMWRTGVSPVGFGNFTVPSNTGYVRIGYGIKGNTTGVIEPSATFVFMYGAKDLETQNQAVSLNTWAGDDLLFDFGLNYHFSPDFKVYIHYNLRSGNAGDFGNGASFNNYFWQSGIGPIQRGNWLGVGGNVLF